jgi:hypothetical protein
MPRILENPHTSLAQVQFDQPINVTALDDLPCSLQPACFGVKSAPDFGRAAQWLTIIEHKFDYLAAVSMTEIGRLRI